MTDTKLKLGELFAGYGGLGLAVEEVFGADLAWYAEYDAAPSKIMAHHWPDLTNYGDVTKVDWATVPPVDIISGGSPCQDLSLAGARRGMADGTRSNLWESMREAIATIKPTYVVWENVRGALSAKATSASDVEQRTGLMGDGDGGHLRALGRVLGDLADLGYDAEWRGLRAADVGAPHGRFRVFLLATRRGAIADGHGGRMRRRATLPGHGESQRPDTTAHRPNDRPCQPRTTEGAGRIALAYSGCIGRDEAVQHHGSGAAAHHGTSLPNQPDSDPLRTGPQRTDWGQYAPAIRRWEAVRGTAPDPTEITAAGRHRLSARFAEWMMGLPTGHVTGVPGITRNEQLKACGNGVVPQQAAAALADMLAVTA